GPGALPALPSFPTRRSSDLYASVANPQRPRPERAAYVGCDNDRYSRTGWGPIALHYDNGYLVMTRGDVRLLSAPLPGQPSEVYRSEEHTSELQSRGHLVCRL